MVMTINLILCKLFKFWNIRNLSCDNGADILMCFIQKFILKHLLEQSVNIHCSLLQVESNLCIFAMICVAADYFFKLFGNILKVVMISINSIKFIIIKNGLFAGVSVTKATLETALLVCSSVHLSRYFKSVINQKFFKHQ